jgi:hypothetical protein
MSQQQNTTNRSDRKLGNQFDLGQFNKKFDENEKIIERDTKLNASLDMGKSDEAISTNLPHKKPVEDLIVNMRNLFYAILEMLLDKQNPIPFIFATPDRHFAFAVLLIIIGTLLLLFSNLMMSPLSTSSTSHEK